MTAATDPGMIVWTVPCGECGMPCKVDEYHPYAACLMFKGCHDSTVVRANLKDQSLLAEAERRVIAYCSLADSAIVKRDALQAQVDAVRRLVETIAMQKSLFSQQDSQSEEINVYWPHDVDPLLDEIRAALGET